MKDKVAWRERAPYMQCGQVPSETKIKFPNSTETRKIIMKNTAYFLTENNTTRALCLAWFLNSTPIRVFLQSFCAKAKRGWFRQFAWCVGLIPVPLDFVKILSRMETSVPSQETLDKLIGEEYGLDDKEVDEMCYFHEQITSTIPREIEEDEEVIDTRD
jgi:hypothetical protein